MRKKILIIFLAIFIIAIGLFSFSISKSDQSQIGRAIQYLKSQPQDAWSTMALAAAGETKINLNHLKSIPSGQESATTYSKYILALSSVGKDPTTFGNEDYLAKLKDFYNLQTNQFGNENYLNDDIWAILALGSVGQENLSIVQDAKDYILNHQNADGGWSYNISFLSSDTNDTAAAIMALLEAGVSSSSSAIQNAISYLKSEQNDDGGFPYLSNSVSDACSDAWAISAIYKLGQDPISSNWIKNGKNPLDHLQFLQDEDGGFWWQAEGDNKFCSSFALIAVLGKHYPVETIYNSHHLRIEGQTETICNTEVYGGTPLDLIINGSKICDYSYSITEYPFGLYLKKINNEQDGWMYMVNTVSATVGAADYYLEPEDEVLWFFGQWLEKGWFPTKVELTKTENLVKIQVKYYNSTTSDWQDLELEGIKVKINSSEFTTDNAGRVEISLTSLEDGFYQVFVETQIINEVGYIRSEKVSLKVGEVPSEHKVGLRVEIEKIKVPEKGEQAVISFSISPDILDFGKLKLGESSTQDLTIANGESKIYLEPEVAGASLFQENLDIDGKFWQIFSTELERMESKTFPVKLTIPSDYSGNFGLAEGEIIFWAIKK
ncbi:MAG: prenyltransferase/squalene oxidase repeat-containing protein [Patescibacteria group bacterium]|nr:prenyltransferase/squalene oxidase repeat-containing protein [Patescibacteria group bacterium]